MVDRADLFLKSRRSRLGLCCVLMASVCAVVLIVTAVKTGNGQLAVAPSTPNQPAPGITPGITPGTTAASEAPNTPQVPTPFPEGAGNSFSGHETNLSPQQLQALVARIAIYPDDLLGLVLTASTQPLEIVEAQRFLEMRKAHKMASVSKDWDPSVIALLNYPDVVTLMDSDIAWTEQLGTSVIEQRAAVLDAIQSFRRQAYSAGNLRSNDMMTVTAAPDGTPQNETFSIAPASPQTIFVPSYDPAAVVAQAPTGDGSAYDWSQPYPYYADSNAIFFPGLWYGGIIGFAFDWHTHQIFRGDRHRDHYRGHDHDHGDVGRNGDGRAGLAPGVFISSRSIWMPGRVEVRQMPASVTRRDLAGIRPATGAGPGNPPRATVIQPMPQIIRGISRASSPSSVQVFRGPPIIDNGAAMAPHSNVVRHFAGASVAAPLRAPPSSMVARPNSSGMNIGMVPNGSGGAASNHH
jgi:hypothetical protein